MANTAHLGLPLLAADQAQKHVTHNEALLVLDDIVHMSAINRTRTSAPGSPSEDDHYIVAAGATGVWSGHDNDLAVYHDAVWTFYTPDTGWHCWIEAEGANIVYTGGAWQGGASFRNVVWSEPVISGGVLTITTSAVTPDAETGSSDSIDSIAGGIDGTTLILAGTTGRTITVNDGGNINLTDTTRVLSGPSSHLSMVRRGANWYETGFVA